MTIKLSICIPTYNRKTFLRETIESIINQADSGNYKKIEVCISDNASTDGTQELINNIQANTPVRIIYSRSERNLGPDANYLRSVELASGDYCWFMGSDDVALPGSLNTILCEIDHEYDIYLFNRVDCDIALRPICNRYWLDESLTGGLYDLADSKQFDKYSRQSKSIGSLFSYLSSIVFKRTKWQAIEVDSIFIGTAYSHVYMLMSFIKMGCILKYCSNHLVLSRGGNDSFWNPTNDGIIKRIMIDIDGYLMLADRLFNDSQAHYQGVLRVLRAERPALSTLAILRLRTNSSSWSVVSKKFHKAGYSKTLIFLIGIAKPMIWLVKQIRATAA